jgi:hypothetical protein
MTRLIFLGLSIRDKGQLAACNHYQASRKPHGYWLCAAHYKLDDLALLLLHRRRRDIV